MGKAIQPPFLPQYGSGAPGASVPHTATYFDTSVIPYTPYIYHSGAWHTFGAAGAGTNAVTLQGTPISATPPTNGQVLQDIGGTWTPQNAAAAGPGFVQFGMAAGAHSSGVVMGSAPINQNALFALSTDENTSPTINTAGGWFLLVEASAAADGYGVAMKICGVGESTTQEPFSDAHNGVTAIWEFSNATWGLLVAAPGYVSTATPAATYNNSKTAGAFILALNSPAATLRTSSAVAPGTAVLDGATSFAGISRTGNAAHLPNAAAGVAAGTITFTNSGAAVAGINLALAIG